MTRKINYQFMEFPDRPDLTTVRAEGREVELHDPVRMCAHVATSIAIFAWKLGEQREPIEFRYKSLPKDQAGAVENALRFYRLEAPFEISWR